MTKVSANKSQISVNPLLRIWFKAKRKQLPVIKHEYDLLVAYKKLNAQFYVFSSYNSQYLDVKTGLDINRHKL